MEVAWKYRGKNTTRDSSEHGGVFGALSGLSARHPDYDYKIIDIICCQQNRSALSRDVLGGQLLMENIH